VFTQIVDILEGEKIRKKAKKDEILRAETFSYMDKRIRLLTAECSEIAKSLGRKRKWNQLK